MKDKCISILKDLTRKKFVVFVKRGNTAIHLSLKLAKSLGHSKVLLQDQGGWLTYKQYAKKEKLEPVELKTNSGVLLSKTIKEYTKCVLLMNSMPGYYTLQNMKLFEEVCKEQKIFLINDVSGSIGTVQAEKGDIIFGSFGKDKPVNLQGHGGFIATDNYEYVKFLEKEKPENNIDFDELFKRLSRLRKRLDYFKLIRNKVMDDLRDYDIIHTRRKGVNVIIKYYSESEKERLINYCNKEKLEYTLCPREIRVMDKAVSIEIKRR